MTIEKKNIFALLWAIIPVIELISGLTPIPNQINYVYSFCVLIWGFLNCKITASFLRAYFKWLFLPFSYIITFIIVSYYGVNFPYSIKYHVLYLPLGLINFTLWFMAGYFYLESISLKYLFRVASVIGLVSLTLALLGIINPDETRIISGIDLPIAAPSAVIFGNILMAGLIFFITIFSLKKTVVVCAFVGVSLAWLLKTLIKVKPIDLDILTKRTGVKFSKGILSLTLAVSCTIMAIFFYPYMSATFSRFFLEGEDVTRGEISLVSLTLLLEYFPKGIGYYTFGYLTADLIPYTTYTASGEQLDGVALHNSFMHFVLEGGLAILIIVILMFWKYLKVIRKLLSWKVSKPLAVVLICWLVIGIIYGMFQQFHGTRYFFGILAFAYAAFERYKKVHSQGGIVSTHK